MTVAAADLATVDWDLLQSGDQETKARLVQACKALGFFYLDFGSSSNNDILNGHQEVLKFAKEYFQQPVEAKMLDAGDDDSRCYKPIGLFSGVDEGKSDNFETVKVLRSGLYSEEQHHLLPNGALDHKPALERLMNACDVAANVILSALSDALGGPRLESSHRAGEASKTFLGVLHYPPPTADPRQGYGHNKHTDVGSLTILLASEPGLEVLRAGIWSAVEPRRKCAVVNVGDTLRFLSGQRLASCVHRVRPSPCMTDGRFSVCYFLRAENQTVLDSGHGGPTMTAADWHDRKFDVFRQGHSEQSKGRILTGGMEDGAYHG